MKISLVVPIFNEEEAVPVFYSAIKNNQDLAQHDLEIVFVNDGSRDHTVEVIESLLATDPNIVLIDFSRNFGKEPALFAGIEHATGEVVIPMDVDLQDPIEVIPQMIEAYRNGFDVVLAKRSNRDSDSMLKRMSANYFYKLVNLMSDSKIPENVGDFRLLSRPVVDAIKLLPENKLFMKGLLSWVGFKTTVVEYSRPTRSVGTSKFNGWKLWNFALEGITSFSTVPLRIWTYMGVSIALCSFIYGAWMAIEKMFWGNPVPGYPSLIVAILFLGGVQLIGIGVLGEYIGRIYIEAKRRPRYIIRKIKTAHSIHS
ncbi:Bactoprenol glucosyl transferase [sediment metagenome]|uniref:Bactoprenol glucosyl transferase n=1 Tax=sediment metagenome TaxID=749907 RepID=D9PKT6_9ZZZZ